MDANEIRLQLGRFYDGTTSEDEEKALHEALQSEELPQELHAERDFLNALHARHADIPDGLESRISKQIDGWNMVEKTMSRKARTVSLRWIAGVAAAMLIMFSVGTMVSNQSDESQTAQRQDTYDNAEDAYVQTQKALMKMSASLNKGLDAMEKVTNKD